jgi:hypothetical protein
VRVKYYPEGYPSPLSPPTQGEGSYEKKHFPNRDLGVRREAMSKTLVGIFVAVFVGALVYEILDRTKPELTEKFEAKVSEGLDSLLMTSEAKAQL